MNLDELQGKWHTIKGTVRMKWGKLTDDDVSQIEGQSERLVGKLQQLYGLERKAAEKELEVWLASQS
ncbi:CsbD family protein [Pendulispora brunnea]|uniref:CsbD family protein n=1 Tax=Pendulispora brunnea TaxID=2905690 RepID=A0ABZ2KAW5_9BACT